MAIVGGGAAGVATAIFAARRRPAWRIVVLDGARKLGAKILISGGGHCNVTNRVVTADDFCGGSRNFIKRVLAALPVDQTVRFFRELGVEFYIEEETGKLWPTTDQARTVLDALLTEAGRLGVDIRAGHRVTGIHKLPGHFAIEAGDERFEARRVVLCTGGQSLPKTGSDGFGYTLARSFGHSLVEPTPALVPLILDGEFHTPLSGISQRVVLVVRAAGSKPIRTAGILLWTHFGVSGPGVLDVSRHWHRARAEGREVSMSVNFLLQHDDATADALLLELAAEQPRMHINNALALHMPARVADGLLEVLGVARHIPLAHLAKEHRRRVARALTDWPLPVRDSRGYKFAEATAGGVPLGEVSAATLESRLCPGLYFAGEILDVDGRIGGFNFQWAWSSAYVAATGMAEGK